MSSENDGWQRSARLNLARRRVRVNLLDWSTEILAKSGQHPAAHHRILLHELDCLTRGNFDRLMILMPPGSAKSTYASLLYPAWWFTQFPHTSIIAAAHTFGLAQYFSRRLRDLITENETLLGYRVSPGERSVSSWRTSTGGEYYAAGTRGGITGRRADLLIIDDPVKSQMEADSTVFRDKMWSWYRSELITRLKPGGRMILIMTRWHDDDLGGRLLKYEKDEWHVLCLPALADTSDPIGREVGEPIWPLWESKAQLTRKRDAIGSRVWAALFQQTPRPPGEGLFKINRLLLTDTVLTTDTDRVVRAWDLAATTFLGDNDPDWTVGLKLACSPSDHFTILDVVRFRGSPREVEEKITSTARADGISVWIGLPEDPGQAGKSQIAYLSGRLAGYRIMAFRETGSKLTRALPLASQIEANNFSIVRGGWNHSLLSEMADFPMSNKDDQVDALVRGFMTLVRMTGQARSVSIPYIAR